MSQQNRVLGEGRELEQLPTIMAQRLSEVSAYKPGGSMPHVLATLSHLDKGFVKDKG